MRYKNKEIISKEVNAATGMTEGTAYVPIKVHSVKIGGAEEGVFINDAFHESTTLDTKLVDLKDKDGNSLGIQEGDKINVPWITMMYLMPSRQTECVSVQDNTTLRNILGSSGTAIFTCVAVMSIGDNIVHYGDEDADKTLKYKISIENGVLRVTPVAPAFLNIYIRLIKESNFNQTRYRKENPIYDPGDLSTGDEYFDDERANPAAYKALNSWKPISVSTEIVQEDMAVLPDSVEGYYAKLGDDTYLAIKK